MKTNTALRFDLLEKCVAARFYELQAEILCVTRETAEAGTALFETAARTAQEVGYLTRELNDGYKVPAMFAGRPFLEESFHEGVEDWNAKQEAREREVRSRDAKLIAMVRLARARQLADLGDWQSLYEMGRFCAPLPAPGEFFASFEQQELHINGGRLKLWGGGLWLDQGELETNDFSCDLLLPDVTEADLVEAVCLAAAGFYFTNAWYPEIDGWYVSDLVAADGMSDRFPHLFLKVA